MKGDVNQVSYAVAKEAIRALTRVAANELGASGINVNLISPIANTPGVEAWRKAEPEYYEQVLNSIPMRRFGDPENDIGKRSEERRVGKELRSSGEGDETRDDAS